MVFVEKDSGQSVLSQSIEQKLTQQRNGRSTKKVKDIENLSLEVNGHKLRLSSISTDRVLNFIVVVWAIICLAIACYIAVR